MAKQEETIEIVDIHPDVFPGQSFEEVIKIENVFTNPTILGSTIIGGKMNYGSGNSCFKFEPDKGVWLGNASFASGPFRVSMAGILTATSANVSGTITASSVHIPDEDTTANSFHVETDGDTFWGCTQSDFTSNNDNATAYVLKTGVAKFQNAIISGGANVQFISDTLDTQTKEILGDFTFGASGAIKMITDVNNGLWLSPTGILGKKAGATTFAIDINGDATFAGTLSAAAGTLGTVTAGIFTGCTFQTATSGERMELGISVGGNVHNLMKYDAEGNVPVMLGGVGVNANVAFRNYTESHIVAIVEQTMAGVVGLYIDMGASATEAGIKIENVGSGYDLEGTAGWWITKAGIIQCEGLDAGENKITNVVDPTENQDAATKKYVDDNPTKQILIENATAGEELAAYDALLISDGTETHSVEYAEQDTYTDMIDPNVWYGQVFKTHHCAGKITNAFFRLYKQGSPTGTVTCSIRAVAGSHPTGNDLATKTLNAADMPASAAYVNFEFTVPLAVTGDTSYAVLLKWSAVNGTNFVRAQKDTGDGYTDGDEQIGSAESWTSYNYDYYFKITQTLIAGKVYKSSTASAAQINHYIGFTDSVVSKDNAFDVVTGGVLAKTGLTVGKPYQLSSTRGAIEVLTTPSETTKRVGIAIKESATVKLLVLNSYITNT